jgi:hypothetical protein
MAYLLVALAGVGWIGPAAAGAAEHSFVGSQACKKCHIKEFKSWEQTKMAQSFEQLKPGVAAQAKTDAGLDPKKDYTKDAGCVRCHVTGFGKPGGFVDIATTPNLAGVGCEVCHGPGGTYIQDGFMTMANKEYKKSELVAVGMTDQVTAAQCTECHNSDSPFAPKGGAFDFDANKTKGTHEKFPLKYKH